MESEKQPSSTYRILDASLNRASEGLRVIEDFLRMSLSDGHLAGLTKHLRHQLTETARLLDASLLISSRDTQNDVGCAIQTDAEFTRESAEDVVHSNLARVQQSLRTLEEYGKTVSVEFAKSIETLRYQTYTLEKAVLTTMISRKSLADSQLYVLIDSRQESDDFEDLVKQLLQAEVDLIQFRDKRLNDCELVEIGLRLTKLTGPTKTRWIMNDRVDLAMASGAAGVHLGQEDLGVADARRIVGAAMIIGVSTHDLNQARQAVLDGANYIGVGPVFSSQTKSFESHPGLSLVEQVAQEIQLPAFAIGGINLGNVERVRQAGLERVAVQGGILRTDSPLRAALDLRSVLE